MPDRNLSSPEAAVQSIRPDRRCWVLPFLRALHEMGGTGAPEEVTESVQTSVDQRLSGSGEEAAKKLERALRRTPTAMAKAGLIKVGQGSWELTPLAKEYLVGPFSEALAGPDLASPGTVEESSPSRALSLRQPWAELVICGIKTLEVRSRPTKIRGPAQIYASMGRLEIEKENRLQEVYGLAMEELPRGVLVGVASIVGSRTITPDDSGKACIPIQEGDPRYAWVLESPRRHKEYRRPERKPQPTFFFPFDPLGVG